MPPRRQLGAAPRRRARRSRKRNATPPTRTLSPPLSTRTLEKPPGGANLFDTMLKEPCPYHQGPVKHTLEECVMLRRHFHKVGLSAEGGRAHNNDKKEDHKAE